MNFDRIAMLLHLEEKLRALPHLKPISNHVHAELNHYAEEAINTPVPELKEAAEAERVRIEAVEKERAAREAQARLDEVKAKEEAERIRREQDEKAVAERPDPKLLESKHRPQPEHRPRQKTQDEMIREAQPGVPQPDSRTDLSKMNNPREDRIENRFQESEAASPSITERRV